MTRRITTTPSSPRLERKRSIIAAVQADSITLMDALPGKGTHKKMKKGKENDFVKRINSYF